MQSHVACVIVCRDKPRSSLARLTISTPQLRKPLPEDPLKKDRRELCRQADGAEGQCPFWGLQSDQYN